MQDRRLIEEYLPIKDISSESSREKSVRRGHISTLHLWWARRPLVASRAAVYGSLVPIDQFRPANGPEDKRASLTRANAARFVRNLCTYPGSQKVIAEAAKHVLEAHAERLTQETSKKVTVDDIIQGRAPRPKVLDMFAGGGSIPLEALRLGCEVHALDLNPVAYIIELCTLVYPQKYGKPDLDIRGVRGPQNSCGEPTWGGLSEEVRYWGTQVLKNLKEEIGDLYPLIPDPNFKKQKMAMQGNWFKDDFSDDVPPGYLMPVGYLWTRTVVCKNPHCRGAVPLVKQMWVCKKTGRYVALKIRTPRGKKQVRFDVVEDDGIPLPADDKWLKEVKAAHKKIKKTELEELIAVHHFGFDPEIGSKAGNATCPFCGTVCDSDYVKAEGCAGRMDMQLMAVACTRPGKRGKVYLSCDSLPTSTPDDNSLLDRIRRLCDNTGLTVPSEPIIDDAKNSFWVRLYGLTNYGQLFSRRQQLTQLTLCRLAQTAEEQMHAIGYTKNAVVALVTYLAVMIDKLADFNCVECTWNYTGGRGIGHGFTKQVLPMAWDYAETNPFNPDAASWVAIVDDTSAMIDAVVAFESKPAHVTRGDATRLAYPDASLDAVITDPPYYDNVSYADLSDFFYVWLKRSISKHYTEHFASVGTPKKSEAVADASRHKGNEQFARATYEEMMAAAFREAHRVLKPGGNLVVVYAHKTTLGWATLVDALRRSGFLISEAWPLDTERKGRMIAMGTAALASSIFLSGRKRDGTNTGSYERDVQPELAKIVRERVETLWEMGVSGADLVIASVGAGLRAFTRFAKVEYANGEEMQTQRFLAEVETFVLESILARLSKEVGSERAKYSLAGLDAPTRFYLLWRYTYQGNDLDSGEAIVFANGTHVELDGANGLSRGPRALIEKAKGKYRLKDFTDRGENDNLGMREDGQSAPLVDCLHRILWLMERHPSHIDEFLRDARPNTEQLRLLAQALAGPALKGSELLMGEIASGSELAALAKLTANWKSVVESADLDPGKIEPQRVGKRQLKLSRGGSQ